MSPNLDASVDMRVELWMKYSEMNLGIPTTADEFDGVIISRARCVRFEKLTKPVADNSVEETLFAVEVVIQRGGLYACQLTDCPSRDLSAAGAVHQLSRCN